uniref:ATP synthase CF1 subunit delta n=1 Tax=Cryptomonas sp. SAG 977-2f TaxID=279061 RepID=A0A679CBV7_9CRYP|nr:ATP synthase CF1 subunit delta [Cryptomonas sp. SAG 977-2f]
MSSKNLTIAQPYAEAFLELTPKKSLDIAINDLKSISVSLSESKDLKQILSNPLITSQVKKNLIKSIFIDRVDAKTLRFLLVLCNRGRILHLDSIVSKAIELAYKAASIEIVKVISSIALTPSQQEALTLKLKSMTSTEHIKLEIVINKDLIGGFIIQIGSKIIDTSLKGQLLQLSSYLGAPLA